MIVKDEQDFLPDCLRSVRGLADQVVVVDTVSSDRTVDVALEHGAEAHAFDWQDDFAAARNESLRHAEHGWILVLDADETIDISSHEEIRRLIQSRELVGYMLRTLNYTDPEGTASVVEHHNLRLFPNHPELRYVGRDPHAQLRCLSAKIPFRVERCSAVIHHQGYRPHVHDVRRKSERNLAYLEAAVRDEPAEPFHAYNLGVTYSLLDRHTDAERELLRAIALSLLGGEDGSIPGFVTNAYLSLALAVYAQSRYEEAAAYCEQALKLAPDFPDALSTRGAALVRLGRLEEALRCYERAHTATDYQGLETSDRSTSGWKALLGMGEVYLLTEQWPLALERLQQAADLSPDNPAIMLGFARAWLGLGLSAQADSELRRLASRPDAPRETWLVLADLELAQQRPEAALRVLETGHVRHPDELAYKARLESLRGSRQRD